MVDAGNGVASPTALAAADRRAAAAEAAEVAAVAAAANAPDASEDSGANADGLADPGVLEVVPPQTAAAMMVPPLTLPSTGTVTTSGADKEWAERHDGSWVLQSLPTVMLISVSSGDTPVQGVAKAEEDGAVEAEASPLDLSLAGHCAMSMRRPPGGTWFPGYAPSDSEFLPPGPSGPERRTVQHWLYFGVMLLDILQAEILARLRVVGHYLKLKADRADRVLNWMVRRSEPCDPFCLSHPAPPRAGLAVPRTPACTTRVQCTCRECGHEAG
jgi:hypothetical protein